MSSGILGLTDHLYGAMILIALFVLLIGFFVDATVLIIMLTPIFLPIVRQLGGDPVHFGIVFILAAAIGNFTPPVALAVASVTLLLVFLPGVVLFLPGLIFG